MCPQSHMILESDGLVRSPDKEKQFISLLQSLWSQKFECWWLNLSSFYPWNNMTIKSIVYLSTTAMPVATKPGKVGMYNEEFPSGNSHNPLITRSCKVTWNIRSVLSLLQKRLWLPNLIRYWLTMRTSAFKVTQSSAEGVTWGHLINW